MSTGNVGQALCGMQNVCSLTLAQLKMAQRIFLRCFKSTCPWAEMESETFQFEEGGCFFRSGRAVAIVKWPFHLYLVSLQKDRLCVEHLRFIQDYVTSFTNHFKYGTRSQKGEEVWLFPRSTMAHYYRESISFGVWQLWIGNTTRSCSHLQGLAIHSKLTTVIFLICKMVITYLEMQAITFLSTREAISRFSYIYTWF